MLSTGKVKADALIVRFMFPAFAVDDSRAEPVEVSAHQAVAKVRERCWQRAWVLDMDIKGFPSTGSGHRFDAIDHDLLLRAVDKHVSEDWQRLYTCAELVEAWGLRFNPV